MAVGMIGGPRLCEPLRCRLVRAVGNVNGTSAFWPRPDMTSNDPKRAHVHPRIESARIGVMGLSWGGVLSLISASEEFMRAYTGGAYRLAAHLPVYPAAPAAGATPSRAIPSWC
jgi:dienelactone hydrolase